MNALQRARLTPASATALVGAAALAALAVYNRARSRTAEHENPPVGNFVTVDGVELHYIARGSGRPVVLLHGNGVTSVDFLLSGLFQRAAKDHRVIAFDRPGFGYSERPSGRIWSAEAQAQLILRALEQLKIERPIVLGHSWGASVALAMGLLAPERIASLVLVSGHYYPTSELASPLLMGPAIPVLGAVLRNTVAPPMLRMMWPMLCEKLFAPQQVPERFLAYPREMSLRSSQLQAEGAESGLLIPDAIAMQSEYAGLRTPLTIVAGDADKVIDMGKQSARLHREIPQSRFIPVSGVGHMVHYFATDRIVSALGTADAPQKRTPVRAERLVPEPTAM